MKRDGDAHIGLRSVAQVGWNTASKRVKIRLAHDQAPDGFIVHEMTPELARKLAKDLNDCADAADAATRQGNGS